MTERNKEYGLDVSSRHVSRKIPLLSKNSKARFSYANTHKSKDVQFWKRILFTVKIKINQIVSDEKTFVHREKSQTFNYRYTLKAVEHGGGNLNVLG